MLCGYKDTFKRNILNIKLFLHDLQTLYICINKASKQTGFPVKDIGTDFLSCTKDFHMASNRKKGRSVSTEGPFFS